VETDLKGRIEQLEAEHAKIWRTITMSAEWRRLQSVEGQLELLHELLGSHVDGSPDSDELNNVK
jgi:hypothetical protein